MYQPVSLPSRGVGIPPFFIHLLDRYSISSPSHGLITPTPKSFFPFLPTFCFILLFSFIDQNVTPCLKCFTLYFLHFSVLSLAWILPLLLLNNLSSVFCLLSQVSHIRPSWPSCFKFYIAPFYHLSNQANATIVF